MTFRGTIRFAMVILIVMKASAPLVAESQSPEGVLPPDSVWFDAESGEVRPIPVEARWDDSENRQSRWLPRPEQVRRRAVDAGASGQGGGGASGGGWFGANGWLGGGWGRAVTWSVLFLSVVLLILGVVFLVSKTGLVSFEGGNTTADRGDLSAADRQTLERIKHLPPELRRSDVNMRGEADRLMEQGRFDQAIILLFGHQLLLLDSCGFLRLARGKTNRRYIREASSAHGETARLLAETVDAFESSYFGRHSMDRRAFAILWEQNRTLEEHVRSRTGVPV